MNGLVNPRMQKTDKRSNVYFEHTEGCIHKDAFGNISSSHKDTHGFPEHGGVRVVLSGLQDCCP